MSPAIAPFGQIVTIGRIFFALRLTGVGFQHFFFMQFITVAVPPWPSVESLSSWGKPSAVRATGHELVARRPNEELNPKRRGINDLQCRARRRFPRIVFEGKFRPRGAVKSSEGGWRSQRNRKARVPCIRR
jgi:hypothetical protein